MTVSKHSIPVSRDFPEEWRPVRGFEGRYEVSNYGRVRALFTPAHGGGFKPGRILKPWPNGSWGHLQLTLWGADGRGVKRYIHRLVWDAFYGPIPPLCKVRHWDGDPLNNRLDNLRCGTHQDNMDDMERHGTRAEGVRHGQAKFTDDEVCSIRNRLKNRELQRVIAFEFGVSQSCISRLKTRKRWSHL